MTAGPRPAVDPADAIRRDMSVLADDSLRGRGTGTPEYDAAARYVAEQFRSAGLRPGNGASWFQAVPLDRRAIDTTTSTISLGDAPGARTFAFGRDVVAMSPGGARIDIHAPVVFVGSGLTIPERGVDDYAHVDVRGKIVAYLPSMPSSLSADERTYYATTLADNARKHGALAAIQLWTPAEEKTEHWVDAVASYEAAGLFTWRLHEGDTTFEQLWAGPELSRTLTSDDALAGVQSMRISIRGKSAVAASDNVVALLPGSDPVLSHEVVVVSAHLDHLGVGRPVNDDSIYNGAVDDASGIASLLEMARMLAAHQGDGQQPRRTIAFVAFAAEEPGSLGSAYFVRHPPASVASIGPVVADLNIDGASVWAFDGIVPHGSEHSTLGGAVARGATAAGTPIVPDPAPGRQSIAGSDQYSFMTAGIPALIVATARPAAVRPVVLNWVRNRYHQPSDDMHQPLDFAAAAEYTRVIASIVIEMANAPSRPAWNGGDFYSRFAKPQ